MNNEVQKKQKSLECIFERKRCSKESNQTKWGLLFIKIIFIYKTLHFLSFSLSLIRHRDSHARHSASDPYFSTNVARERASEREREILRFVTLPDTAKLLLVITARIA